MVLGESCARVTCPLKGDSIYRLWTSAVATNAIVTAPNNATNLHSQKDLTEDMTIFQLFISVNAHVAPWQPLEKHYYILPLNQFIVLSLHWAELYPLPKFTPTLKPRNTASFGNKINLVKALLDKTA